MSEDVVVPLSDEVIELNLRVESTRVDCRLTCTRRVKQAFLADRYPVVYDVPVDDVDPSILAIPAVALVAPVAWLYGADVHVATLDAQYLEALEAVKAVYQSFYPWFRGPDSHLVVERPVANPAPPTAGRVGQLFTAGVDSLTTYLRHRAERPELFAIWETPHYQDAEWRQRQRHLQRFADAEGRPIHYITPNLDVLNRQHLRLQSTLEWWPKVTFALILTGLCAPITVHRGLARLYIASSASQGRIPHGSHPQTDNQLRWAGTRVQHDGHELTRPGKLAFLSQHPEYLPHLVIYHPGLPLKTASNCTELMLLGVDPRTCTTFDGDLEDHVRQLQDVFTHRTRPITEDSRENWIRRQQMVPDVFPEWMPGWMRDHLTWLKGFDFAAYQGREESTLAQWRERAQATLNTYTPRIAYAFRRLRGSLLEL